MKVASMEHLRQAPDAARLGRAFDEFGPRAAVRGRLVSARSGSASCDHAWRRVTQLDQLARIRLRHDEESFDEAGVCGRCGATCLRDDGVLWAYDATSPFGAEPVKIHTPKYVRGKR